MSWEDRLREAAYTSPSGVRLTFQFEGVSRETSKRTAAFEFPGVDNAYVQDNGHGSRRYPLQCFFNGEDHDLNATTFEAALLERGVGKLEHPLYGTFDVVPFGDITRRDDLKHAANQSVVEVTFWTTTGAVYPDEQSDPESELHAAIRDFDGIAGQELADSTEFAGAVEQAQGKAAVEQGLKEASGALGDVTKGDETLAREFSGLQTSISLNLDGLIADPGELASQVSELLQIPARVEGDIETIIGAYEDLVEDILGSSAADPEETLAGGPQRRKKAANDFHLADHRAMAAVNACVLAAANATLSTRPQAIKIAERILQLFETVVAWRDESFEVLADVDELGAYQVDAGGAYQAVQRGVALTVGFLIQVSFTLVPERRLVLDKPRSIIELCAQLYGQVDEKLDFLIATNDLSGAELLELPAGKTILYYPA